jgi:hypothetical protein
MWKIEFEQIKNPLYFIIEHFKSGNFVSKKIFHIKSRIILLFMRFMVLIDIIVVDNA